MLTADTVSSTPSSEQLLLDLHARVTRMAEHYARCSRLDRDDLLQEAWLALLEAVDDFDPALGELTPYLIQRARWRMLDAVKYTRLRVCISADDLDVAAPEFLPDNGMELDEFTAQLTALQQRILRCLLNGLTWRDTGAELGFTSANVAYHVREIRRRYLLWNKSHAADSSFSAAAVEIDLELKG